MLSSASDVEVCQGVYKERPRWSTKLAKNVYILVIYERMIHGTSIAQTALLDVQPTRINFDLIDGYSSHPERSY